MNVVSVILLLVAVAIIVAVLATVKTRQKDIKKVAYMMDKALSLNSEYAASCGATCTYRPEEPDLMIYADEGQISQILINLIKNALQAGAKHIDISARMGKEDEVIIQVANDGEPIPVSAQEQIFVPFYTTKKEGSGIGLSLARQIMRQHNGTIDLLRSDGSQTVFQLIFR